MQNKQARITVQDPATGREVSWQPTSMRSALAQARIEEAKGARVRIISRNGKVVRDTISANSAARRVEV